MRFAGISRLLSVLAWRNIFRNKRRTLLTFLAISAGVWCCVSLSAIARGMSNQLAKDKIHLLTGHAQIHAKGYVDDPTVDHSFIPQKPLYDGLAQSPLIGKYASRVRVPGVVMSERESLGVTIVGISPGEEKGVSFIGDGQIEGAMLGEDDADGIVIGKRTAELLQTGIGKRVVVMSENAENVIADRGYVVKGLFRAELETTEKSFVFIGRASAQRMLGMGEKISEIAVTTHDRKKSAPLAAFLKKSAPDLEIHTWEDLIPFVVSVLKMQDNILDFWFFIVLITVSFGFMNTLFMAIFERLREIGMMHALGMKAVWLIFEIIFESLFVLAGACLFGNAAAYLTVWSLSDGIDVSAFAKGVEMIGSRSTIYPLFYARDVISANVMLFFIGILSSLYPAWRASSGSAAQALQRA